MSVNDQDLELLETYLDDELSPSEQESLRRRLSSEPPLAAAMETLRDQRQMRSQWLSAAEPSGDEIERLITSVRKSITREQLWGQRAKWIRRATAMAACLVVGIIGGYGLRGFNNTPGANYPTAIVNGQTPVSFEQQQPPEPISFNPVNVGTLSNSTGGPYQIRIVDDAGHLLGVQRFQTADQAQQFRNQFTNWQSQHQHQ
jgi:anti-sigma factor RsiW